MSNSINDSVELNNGQRMPWLGFGVCRIDEGRAVEDSVQYALDVGYRSIDTAAIYKNESGVGRAIQESDVPREEIFLTTKLWNDDQRKKRTQAAFEESLARLQVDYVDLYLLHWPVADCYKDSWRELEKIYRSGRARAIGLSNFMPHHLDDLLPECEILPTVNQVEFHPRLVQPDLQAYCRSKGIQMQAWSPLMQGRMGSEQAILQLAKKYQKTPAQIVLRWDLQHQVVTIPKSATPARIAENANIFDFELSREDMKTLDALDDGKRLGPDPYDFKF